MLNNALQPDDRHPAHFRCTKTYGHEQGLSCVFRQHRATSHCAQLHGYALGFSFEFGCKALDQNGWVVDFGSLKPLKAWLANMFDHTLVLAQDDPEANSFEPLADRGLVNLHVVPAVGCEAFAHAAAVYADNLVQGATGGRAWLRHCTVSEHGGNSATWAR